MIEPLVAEWACQEVKPAKAWRAAAASLWSVGETDPDGEIMQRITDGVVGPVLRGGIAALGNFDGFHAGHQAVVGHALAWARVEGRPALVVTFDPHPARLFRPDLPPFQLTRLDQKLELLAAFEVDATVVLRFDHAFAALSGAAFVGDWLAARLGLTGVVTGEDFTFGRGREGDVASLARLGAAHGIVAATVAPVRDVDAMIISSTRVREALRRGDCQAAARLLTRPFAIRGLVEHGDKRGRSLGVPTANMALGDYVRPAYGVYAVRARLADGRTVDGVANLGVRPMFAPPKEGLETHLFDWSGDLYDQEMTVELHHFIRPEWALDGIEALKRQIAADSQAARALLAR